MLIEYVLLFIITPLVGAWATGVGVLFGLDPIAVWIITTIASVLPGLAAASLVIGPALALTAVLLLGVDRLRYFLWTIAFDVVGFGLATAFWTLVLT